VSEDDLEFEFPAPPLASPFPNNKDLMAAKWCAVLRNIQRLRVLFKVLESHRRDTYRHEIE
jgi:hypothetical protein